MYSFASDLQFHINQSEFQFWSIELLMSLRNYTHAWHLEKAPLKLRGMSGVTKIIKEPHTLARPVAGGSAACRN
jgi:hypothetical protein